MPICVSLTLTLALSLRSRMVDIGGAAGFVGGADVLPQAVEGGGDAVGVERGRSVKRVFDLHTGDKARGEFAAEGGILGEMAQG
jgi:hypothetical protein